MRLLHIGWLTLAFSSCSAVAALAQDAVPALSSLADAPSRYQMLLQQRLMLDSARFAPILLVVQPSFEPEYALWVQCKGSGHLLTYQETKQNFITNCLSTNLVRQQFFAVWFCRPLSHKD